MTTPSASREPFSLRHLQQHLPWTLPYSEHFEATAYPLDRVKHDVLHLMKSLGRVAAECENHDHGRDRKLFGPALAKEVADFVICALHIARLEGFDLHDAVVNNSEARNAASIPPEVALSSSIGPRVCVAKSQPPMQTGPGEGEWYCGGCGASNLEPRCKVRKGCPDELRQGERESVDDVLELVESYGPWGTDINESFRNQIVLAEEVKRLRGLLAETRPYLDLLGEPVMVVTQCDAEALAKRIDSNGAPRSTVEPMLPALCEALGWQGGTIHQALAEVRRLRSAITSRKDTERLDFLAEVTNLNALDECGAMLSAEQKRRLRIGSTILRKYDFHRGTKGTPEAFRDAVDEVMHSTDRRSAT